MFSSLSGWYPRDFRIDSSGCGVESVIRMWLPERLLFLPLAVVRQHSMRGLKAAAQAAVMMTNISTLRLMT